MSEYLTDDEQVQRLKALWQRYGNWVLTAVIVVALLVFGWRWLEQRQIARATEGSMIYQQLLISLAEQDSLAVDAQAEQLIQAAPKTVYAQFAALFLAREAVYDGEYEKALNYLNWVMQQTKHKAISQITRLRIARILLAQSDYATAQQTLAKVDDAKYLPLIEEVRGDIWLALGDTAQARAAYSAALAQLPTSGVSRPVLTMKLYNLPVDASAQVVGEINAA
jgi:predicted negative regulator of RcsB-dependent stress response